MFNKSLQLKDIYCRLLDIYVELNRVHKIVNGNTLHHPVKQHNDLDDKKYYLLTDLKVIIAEIKSAPKNFDPIPSVQYFHTRIENSKKHNNPLDNIKSFLQSGVQKDMKQKKKAAPKRGRN